MVKLDRESIYNYKHRKLKKNIGILGGTFDPPHFGHLRISIRALHLLKLDEIWWVVSMSNPLKKNKQITEFQDGILPWSYKNPVALVFDEYDAGRPDVMFVIQRILESEGKLTLLDQS